MVKVSVIVAVYNAEKHLKKCLDSLVGQTLEELEVIAVDDGSTDSSRSVLEDYAARYSKIKYFHKQNGGAADARNFGLTHASGEYIGYVDSDDFVDPDMYEVMYKKAGEADSDIVECNLRHSYVNSEDVEVMHKYYERGELLCFGRYVVWNKIYRRDWLLESGAHFPVRLIYEDVAFIAKLVPYIRRYAYVDIAPVCYVQRAGSVNNSTSEKTMHIFEILRHILNFYTERDFYKEFEDELEYLYTRILLCSSFFRMCAIPCRDLRKRALQANWRQLTDTFPHWRKNRILNSLSSRQALFMKTVNAWTYQVYAFLARLHFKAKDRIVKKWE